MTQIPIKQLVKHLWTPLEHRGPWIIIKAKGKHEQTHGMLLVQLTQKKPRFNGIETGFNWEFIPAWKFGLNYTWTETEIKDSKLGNPPLNDTPEHIVNASLNGKQLIT